MRMGARQLRLIAIGALLYGIVSWVTNIFPLASAVGVDLRPGVAVPLFFGFAFGPFVGFFTGAFGNFFSDALSGYVQFPPEKPSGNPAVDFVRSTILTWQIGNGLMGLVAGLWALVHHRYETLRDQLRALGVAVIAVAVGVGFASFADILFYDQVDFTYALREYFIPAVQVNAISAVILVPILLFNYARLDTSSTDWVRSKLMQRIVLAILLSAALPVALLGLFLTQQTTSSTEVSTLELGVKLGFTVVLTLLLAVANAGLVAISISQPLLRLTRAAQLMEAGQFTSQQAAELQATQGNDELARLSGLFGKMASEVIQREQSLRTEVQQLRIEIDEAKRQRMVSEVTETDFFQDLQEKARTLRRRSAQAASGVAAPSEPTLSDAIDAANPRPSPAPG